MFSWNHYNDVIMGAIASQITSLTIVYSTVYSGADQIKHQSSTSLAFVRGNHRGQVNSSHKGPVTRKMFPFDDVIMKNNRHTDDYPVWNPTESCFPGIPTINLYHYESLHMLNGLHNENYLYNTLTLLPLYIYVINGNIVCFGSYSPANCMSRVQLG